MLRQRADWSRPLPCSLVIPDVMTVTTLADARAFIEQHLPAHYHKLTWQVVADDLKAAAEGADPHGVAIALRLALMLEGVPCYPQYLKGSTYLQR